MQLLIITALFFTIEAEITLQRDGLQSEGQPKRAAPKIPEEHHITQRVNNFNVSDKRTWSMRYFSNDQFFVPGGPIFLLLGGGWQITPDKLQTGQIYDMAEEHKGYMFYTEHRYYGLSYPTKNMSTDNLNYLSVDQALVDVTVFIEHVKKNIKGLKDSKVVVIGCSYSASMATWVRLKYPTIVDIAYASSAPLRAVADFDKYYVVVSDTIRSVSQKCLKLISKGASQLQEKLQSPDCIEELSKTLNTCSTIKNEEPYRSYLFGATVAKTFANLMENGGLNNVTDACEQLSSTRGSEVMKLLKYVKSTNDGSTCIDGYDEFVAKYRRIENTNDPHRPWIYQTCTEFGFYQTSNAKKQPFGKTFGLDFFVNMCRDLFGKNFGYSTLEAGINRTNLFYGSSSPQVTKVVLVYGTVDPWHRLGPWKDLNPLAPVIMINGTTQCEDLKSVEDSDSAEMKAAKKRVKELIAKWLR